MKIISLLFCLICILTNTVKGQTIISGKILDQKNLGVPFVNVLIVENFSKPTILAYILTDEQGSYILRTNLLKDSLYIMVKGFNIQTTQKVVLNKTSTINIKTREESITLKEVHVKGTKIWENKDTLNYLVSSFKSDNDVTIGDVLKKMPGIHVTSSGSIEYKGRPINKFYIEGLDLLKSRYGIATNNLSPNDIATVQVLEHHQPIKALKKVNYSDQAAINLKLKESAKGLFSIIALLGVGYNGTNMLGEGDLIASYFTRKKQYLATYKGNNDGKDIGNEIKKHNDISSDTQFTNLLTPTPPDIDKSKYYNNVSHIATSNNIIKGKKGNDLNIALLYFNDKEERNSYSKTSYMLPDGKFNIIDETIAFCLKTNKLAIEGGYEVNKEKIYLSEAFGAYIDWINGAGDILSKNEIYQKSKSNNFNLSNNLHWIAKKNDYSGWDIQSYMELKSNTQNLLIEPCIFPELFKQESIEGIDQHVRLTRFDTKNSASMLTALMLRKIRITPRLFVNASYDDMNSELKAVPQQKVIITDNQLNNDTYFLNLYLGASATVSYTLNRLNVNLYLPITYNFRRLNQRIHELELNKNKFIFEPSAKINLTYNRWDLSASYMLVNSQVGIEQLYSGYILADYRNITSYEPDLSDKIMHRTGISINYKDIFNLFFTNIHANYNYFLTNVLYGQTFNGILSKIITKEAHTYGSMIDVGLGLSKGFDWKKLNIDLQTQWYNRNAPQLRQEQIIRYGANEIAVTGKLNIELLKFLSIYYTERWSKSWSHMKDGESFPAVSIITSQVKADIKLPLGIGLTATYYNYYNNRAEGNKSFTLADIGLQYTWKTTTFYIDWNNIFDIRKYVYSSLDGLNQYYSEYMIRPSTIMLKVRFKIK